MEKTEGLIKAQTKESLRSLDLLKKELEALDYPAVLQSVAELSSLDLTRRQIEDTLPIHNPIELNYNLSLAREAQAFLQDGQSILLHSLEGIDKALQDALKDRVLDEEQLFLFRVLLKDVSALKNRFTEFERLNEIAVQIKSDSRLQNVLEQALSDQAEISPSASSHLKNLYAQLSDLTQQRSEKARNFAKRNAEALMDGIYTTIHSRLTFLIRANNKNSFGGLVHGTSQSGLAYYVEPEPFVEINNRIIDLELQIEQEKEQIRRDLSRKIKASYPRLSRNLELLVELDQALAKGAYVLKYDGVIPTVSKKNETIQIKKARHPLLDQKTVVANDYLLDHRTLIISGPNTGGKSVSLKTIGLFCALAQSGFPVQAQNMSIPFFEQFFFDLQDNASIQENLSTFSAHIKKLAEILDQADENALILLDEIGHGTDPAQGASLAQAIIEKLMERRPTILSTTHYESIKNFGVMNPDIQIGAMEFDDENLAPTYRFLNGVSSNSFAFDIARIFHIDEQILQRADNLQKENQSEQERKLEQIDRLQKELQKEKEEFEKRLERLHESQRNADALKAELENQKKNLEENYLHDLNEMIDQRKKEADLLIEKLRKKDRFQNYQIMNELDALKEEAPETRTEKTFQKGDYVNITSLNIHGEIVELSRKKATVAANNKRVQVSLDNLEKIKKPAEKSQEKYIPKTFTRFPLELNIIGLRVHEGLEQLDHYLDQAVVHNIKNVRIIHGMGSGKLRNAVWKDLKGRSYVRRFEAAGPNQGGLGATLVELK